MIDREDLVGALESYGDHLRRDIAENDRAIEHVDLWVETIDFCVKCARESFDLVKDPESEIGFDVECGDPCVYVTVDVVGDANKVSKDYNNYVRLFCATSEHDEYGGRVVLCVNHVSMEVKDEKVGS